MRSGSGKAIYNSDSVCREWGLYAWAFVAHCLGKVLGYETWVSQVGGLLVGGQGSEAAQCKDPTGAG